MWTNSDPALHYRCDGGADPVLVLLHETGGDLRSWDRVTELLKDRFRIVRFDQRGLGQSEKVRTEYRQEDLADDILKVLAAAGVDGPVGLIATAGACVTAAQFAIQHRERVSGLVCCSPSLTLDDDARRQAAARAELVSREGMRPITDIAMTHLYPLEIRGEDYAHYRDRFLCNDPVGFALASLAFGRSNVTPSDVRVPTLLLAGTHDLRPVKVIAGLKEQMQSASMEIIDGAGHVMPMQTPEAVATHGARFFASTFANGVA